MELPSSEYCKIFKNTYFEEHLPTVTSGAAYKSALSEKACNLPYV